MLVVKSVFCIGVASGTSGPHTSPEPAGSVVVVVDSVVVVVDSVAVVVVDVVVVSVDVVGVITEELVTRSSIDEDPHVVEPARKPIHQG